MSIDLKAAFSNIHDVTKKQLNFPWAIKSFMGFLEGTHKAKHTIASYRLDLNAFQNFLLDARKWTTTSSIRSLTPKDLQLYSDYLKNSGQKTNTRRRKLISLKQFLEFLYRRGYLASDLSSLVVTPAKIERVPFTLAWPSLISKIKEFPHESELHCRNRVLIWILLETGCLVSELTQLKYSQFERKGKAGWLNLIGKNSRGVPISVELLNEVERMQSKWGRKSDYLFLGFNRFGPVTSRITPRGVELLVKSVAVDLGHAEVTPRTLRHSTVKHWLENGVSETEVQNRLGLKTAYAFRILRPMLSPESQA